MANPKVFNIPAGADFLQSLVVGLKAQLSEDELSRALILLPTRRACQHLREAFLAEAGAGDKALLLPDIRPLAEVEEEELMLSGDAAFLRQVAEVPPAMDAAKRRVLLAQLVAGMNMPGYSKAQAFLLAGDLAHLIDDALIEGCDLNNLAALAPERYAAHWQQVIEFLKIVNQHWSRILQEEGAIDAVDRRQRLTRLLIAHWQKHPPAYPVIAAGSTGSQPVTAELLKTISRLPKGRVVLPGLDQHLEEEAWAVLEASHPHYFLARLLKTLECERGDVPLWPQSAEGARAVLLSETMRPAEATDRWRLLRKEDIAPEAWQGLEVVEAAQEHQEAMAAALMLRKAAEEGGTAALITPDRALAKRVVSLMRRWNIELDDSAGRPLAETPVGSFLNLLLDLPGAGLRPSGLMAFFKHPFAGLGLPREKLLFQARGLEMGFFRKQPRGRGLKTWLGLLKADAAQKENAEMLEALLQKLALFTQEKTQALAGWVDDLREAAVSLAADESQLWREAEGEALAELLESLSGTASDFTCDFADFAEIFRTSLREKVVRRPWGQHPRLAILGLLEARLLRFDRVILGGLNEGVWPQERRVDPWMSPAMRVDLGCSDPEARIGQMAHDFVQQAAGQNVALLRSRRKGEAPTIPSRWLLRLDAVRALAEASLPPSNWLEWAAAVDFCDKLEPCEAPAIKVPVAALPKKLSASNIELWLRDPYAFYARTVLRLKALDGLDAEFSARERGNLIHEALDDLARTYPDNWPPRAQADFVAYIQKGMAAYGCTPEERMLLSARLPALARAYWQFENERRAEAVKQFTEIRGTLPMQLENYSFRLEARADRIDQLKAGGHVIIDFKTTRLPAVWQLDHGLRPQLYTEAIIADGGGFADIGKEEPQALIYLGFDQGQGETKKKNLPFAPGDAQTLHRAGLEEFIRAFLQEEARFLAAPRPQLLDPAPDYARLARVAEWSKGAVAQEEGEA